MNAKTKTAPKTRTGPAVAEMAQDRTAGQDLVTTDPNAGKAARQETTFKDRQAAFVKSIRDRAESFKPLLQASGISFERFVTCCQRGILKDPTLVKCDAGTYLQAALTCADDGLVPDGRQAAIVAYKDTERNIYVATYIPMYQGMIDVAHRSGKFTTIHAHVVYKSELADFKVRLGTDPMVHHIPSITRGLVGSDDDKSDPIVGAYAYAKTKPQYQGDPGEVMVEWIPMHELARMRNRNKKGPGKAWPAEMDRKGPLRRLYKYLPRSAEMEKLLSHDEEAYVPGEQDHDEERKGAAAIPDSALLGDVGYTPVEPYEADDDEGEEQADDGVIEGELVETDVAAAAEESAADEAGVMCAMLAAADDVETLDSRYDGIKHGEDYPNLSADGKAAVDLAFETRKAEIDPGDAPTLKIITGSKTREYPVSEDWKNSMLAKLATPADALLKVWWEKNLPNVRFACTAIPAEAGRVVVVAVTKGLPGAKELVDEFGPFQ